MYRTGKRSEYKGMCQRKSGQAVSHQWTKAVPGNPVAANAENHQLAEIFFTGAEQIKKNRAKPGICSRIFIFYIISLILNL